MTKKSSSLKQLKDRWRAETPLFWKRVIKVMTALSTVCLSLLALTQVPGFDVDPVFTKIVSYVLAACVACGVEAKLTQA